MRWSWKVGEVAGIGIFIHATFFLLIALVAISHFLESHDIEAAVLGVVFILSLFGSVLLHELGHALTAKQFGIKTRDITLLPIGGVARLERIPEKPMQEFWVAVAGPAVNLAIAAVLLVFLSATNSLEYPSELSVTDGSLLGRILVANITLAIFNMLPAFPMDGGRVLRALLATQMDYVRATQIAATLGQGLALIFGLIGFFVNPILMFIALFVWIGAAQEASASQIKFALGGIPVNRAMITHFRVLAPTDSLIRVISMILDGSQTDFPVLENGMVVGILTRTDLLVALARNGQDQLVRDVMHRDIHTVEATEMLDVAFAKLQECQCQTLPVTYRGELVGMITAENVGEFVMIQAAVKQRGSFSI